MINKNQIYSNLDPNCVRNIQSKRKTCRSMLLTSAFFVLLKAKSYQCSGLLTCTTAIKLRRSLFVAWARYYYVQSQSWLMLSILKTTLMHISKTIAPYTSTAPDNNNAQFTRGTLRKNNISILTSWLCALHIVGFFFFFAFYRFAYCMYNLCLCTVCVGCKTHISCTTHAKQLIFLFLAFALPPSRSFLFASCENRRTYMAFDSILINMFIEYLNNIVCAH